MSFRMLAAAAVISLVPALAQAESFPLDSRFVDNDGDMVADIPTDSSQWVDPSTLIFAYTPV